jgi:hypothetical protein
MAGLRGGETKRRKGVENLDKSRFEMPRSSALNLIPRDPADHDGGGL